jgi:hypothetical protein
MFQEFQEYQPLGIAGVRFRAFSLPRPFTPHAHHRENTFSRPPAPSRINNPKGF